MVELQVHGKYDELGAPMYFAYCCLAHAGADGLNLCFATTLKVQKISPLNPAHVHIQFPASHAVTETRYRPILLHMLSYSGSLVNGTDEVASLANVIVMVGD